MLKKRLKTLAVIFNENMSMASKLQSFMIVIVIIPVVLLNSLFYNMLYNVYRRQMEQSYEHTIDQYYDKIRYKLDVYTSILSNIAVNGIVQDTFRHQYGYSPAERVEIIRSITEEINSIVSENTQNELYNVTLYPLNPDFPSDGRYLGNFSDVADTAWYEKIVANKKYDGLFFSRAQGSHTELLSLIRPIFDTDGTSFHDVMGIAKIDLNAEILFRFDSTESDFEKVSVAVLEADGNVAYSDNVDEAFMELLQDAEIFSQPKNLLWQDGNIVIHKRDVVNHLVLVLSFTDAGLQVNLRNIRLLVIGFNLILVGISALLIFGFTKIIVRRIKILTQKMKQVEGGHLEVSVNINGKDEVAELDASFNAMLARIKSLIDEQYIQQLEKTEAELKALQYQINPHFLYNTLESINQMASLHMDSHIATISQKLGEMLRYNLDKDENTYVTLEKEIYHIKNYVQIQQIRFDNHFDIIYDIPDEALEFKVFKFMLQPLIENALTHGLEGAGYRGYIEIAVSFDQEELCIKVQDNGRGMSKEKTALLMENINQKEDYFKHKNSIGLQNVQRRIKLIYGEQYGLVINSKDNSGTQIIIKIPKLRGDGND